MKRFSFPLERVLALRRHEIESAQARLGEIERRKLQARRQAESLQREFIEFGEKMTAVATAKAADLQAGGSYLRRLSAARQGQLETLRHWEQERQKQLQQLVEIRRKVKLLETLRAKKWRAHFEAAGREEEAQAAESYLAKWVRERVVS